MIPVKHIDPEDLPLYAMQLLSPEENEEMTLHLQHSAEARRVLGEFYGDLTLYAQTAEMHSPPAQARQRLMKHVAREKKVIPMHLMPVQTASAQPEATYTPRPALSLMEEAPRKSFAAKVLPWAGWALAAGLALEAGSLYQQRDHLQHSVTLAQAEAKQAQTASETPVAMMDAIKDPAAVHVVLTGTGVKPPPQGRATYVADKGSLVFLASNLEPLQSYKTYELWIIPADGRDAIPAGTFRPDANGNASVILPQLQKGIVAKTFGVTIEDGEGSSQPTLPIVLKGTAS